MTILLDTHIFLWLYFAKNNLTPRATALLTDPANTLFLSIASVWEMQIKAQQGKLTLPRPLPELVAGQQQANSVRLLPVQLKHVLELGSLPLHHKDPFDRLLIAQANAENMSLLSADTVFSRYFVALLG